MDDPLHLSVVAFASNLHVKCVFIWKMKSKWQSFCSPESTQLSAFLVDCCFFRLYSAGA